MMFLTHAFWTYVDKNKNGDLLNKTGFSKSDFNRTHNSIEEDINEQDNEIFIPDGADANGVMMFM